LRLGHAQLMVLSQRYEPTPLVEPKRESEVGTLSIMLA
jgi:hypothetical protein